MFKGFLWYFHICMLQFQMPGCITDVRRSDCAADVIQFKKKKKNSDEVPVKLFVLPLREFEVYPPSPETDLHEAFSMFPVNAAVGLHVSPPYCR